LINGSEYNNSFEVTDWSLVDIFCYFSHEFITIPPTSWISTCRNHGVQIIGTVITEWEDGFKVCQELFQSPESAQHAAEYLIQLAIKTQIDGWLINIENPIPLDLIDNLKLFLTTLTQGMHSALGDEQQSQVIWYDAVTIEGKLRWQDGLTSLNKPFFDLCDGIFINYTWKDDSITTTLDTLAGISHSSSSSSPHWGHVICRLTPGERYLLWYRCVWAELYWRIRLL
jgi:mannosyl-glycoprotein endo-beta-N-acetylglucosaminidase